MKLTDDQEFFRQTTERFLTEHAAPEELRRLRHDETGYEPHYWRRGAELGWTSLLVSEAHGGGTISGAGLVDLSLVAYEFGRRAAAGPLIATNVVAATLSAHDAHLDVLEGLLSGNSIASWCPPPIPMGAVATDCRPTVRITRSGDDVILNGEVRPVESAPHAAHLLVTGREDFGLTQVLVPTDVDGLSVVPMETVDLSRRFGAVTLHDVRLGSDCVIGPPTESSGDVERQFFQTITLLNAEAVGAMQSGFDMTMEWMFDRFSFGRPLASYQALKHRCADMLTRLEASHAVSDAACLAAENAVPSADELASAAKAYVGQFGGDLLHECVQLHGGIGITFEHDLHLYLRRFTVNRSLAGTPAQHRQRIAALLAARPGLAA
ncbi:MAG TPA: acyl-CoA dehydrogenase family protein [Acidimicrobiales bacterium]|nr:acyl-CoA dehydrogenase family protein [Acidimicrobiales bacterium]